MARAEAQVGPAAEIGSDVFWFAAPVRLAPVFCELIGEPIKQSAELTGEPIKGRAKTGTSQSTG